MPCNSCNQPNSCTPVCPTIDLKSFMVGVVSVICFELFAVGFAAVAIKLFH